MFISCVTDQPTYYFLSYSVIFRMPIQTKGFISVLISNANVWTKKHQHMRRAYVFQDMHWYSSVYDTFEHYVSVKIEIRHSSTENFMFEFDKQFANWATMENEEHLYRLYFLEVRDEFYSRIFGQGQCIDPFGFEFLPKPNRYQLYLEFETFRAVIITSFHLPKKYQDLNQKKQ